jgi:hypothetical protein
MGEGKDPAGDMPILITMLLIALLLIGAGFACERLFAPRIRVDFEAISHPLVTGWAVLGLAGVVCAVGGVSVTGPAIALGVIGAAGLAVAGPAAAGLWRIALAWVLLLPMLAIASVIPATMPDEFPYLLPNVQSLVEYDVFPDRTRPNVWTSKPEYPPALSLIAYAAARFGGHDIAYPGKIFTVLLAGAFAIVLAAQIAGRIGQLAAIAIGVMLATVLNPFFDPRIALTAYNDTPTGFVLALCVAASWRACSEPQAAWRLHAAAAAIVLVLLRETSLVFVVGLAAGLLLCRQYRLTAWIVLPALVTFGLWRIYIITAGWTSSMSARPFAAWDWSGPFTMLRVLFSERLANNPVLGLAGVGFALLCAALCVWVVRSGDRRIRTLVVITGAVAILWCAFVAWAYVAVYRNQVLTANSAWRYLSEIGPLLIFAAVAAVASALPERIAVTRTRAAVAIGVAACFVPVIATLATWRHWRIDCRYPDVVAVRGMTKALGDLRLGSDKIAVIHPSEPDWYAEAIDYELRRPVRSSVPLKSIDQATLSYRLDLRPLDRGKLAEDRLVPPIEFARRDGAGWNTVLTIAAKKLDGC